MSDKRRGRSQGHEHVPDEYLDEEIVCPVCGKVFVYKGGYGHGNQPVCSYHCQMVLVRQYRESREWSEIQTELAGERGTYSCAWAR